MSTVHFGYLLFASLMASAASLGAMYFLLTALGLPRFDFAAITGGWVRAAGRYAKFAGTAVFALGGFGWAFLYAAFWPFHSVPGAMAYTLVPFAVSCFAVLPQLNSFRTMVQPLPGFVWVQTGGRNALVANLAGHLIFGLLLGLFYR